MERSAVVASTPPPAKRHVPVLLERCLALLTPALEAALTDGRTPFLIDATLGMGGHSSVLLERFPTLHLIGIDRDPQALELAGERLARYQDRTDLVHAVYDEITEVLDNLSIAAVDGVLMDLGISSLQIDETKRGFAYSHNAPLDMRMDGSRGRSASDIVNDCPEPELASLIRRWGEEKFAARIARRIAQRRAQAPLRTTAELVEVIRSAIPAAAARTGGHPAKRTFQALRIEVNQELTVLRRAMPAAISALAVGGRCVVMSYHSLEDKIVKKAFAAGASSSAPPGFPVELEEHRPELRLLTRGVETPGLDEIANNPRATSARLRAAERIRMRRTA